MTTVNTQAIQAVPLDMIARSATNRTLFDEKTLTELAASILEKGVVQPIIVRPIACIEDEARRAQAHEAKARFELVVGERRWRASKIAGKDNLPAIVLTLTDHDALTLQVIENAQRENPDPLEEAEQWHALLQGGKISVDALSAKIGKSKRAIYERTKLRDLPESAKAALRKGKITVPVAVLIARIPSGLLADEATQEILRGHYDDEPMTFANAQRLVFRKYMTALKDATFDIKDTTLVPGAGACAACPKRTGNQRELFADVGRADVCTDTGCYHLKAAAARERLLDEARKAGKKIVSAEEAKALYPYANSGLGYNAPAVELDARCPFDLKRTWGQLVAKVPKAERPQILVAVDPNGATHELIGKKEASEVVKTLGLIKEQGARAGDVSPAAIEQRNAIRETKDANERTVRAVDLAISAIIAKQTQAKDSARLHKLLFLLAEKFAGFDTRRRVAKRHGYATPKKDGDATVFYRKAEKAAAGDPVPFALEAMLWQTAGFVSREMPSTVAAACRIYGIDLKKINEAAKEKPAQAKNAGKKARK